MTHIIAGYPDIATSEAIADIMIAAGVDFLEVQIPFSDPMADGPTFMRANSVAVKNWTTTENCFELMKRLRTKTDIPLLFMGYYNSIFHLWVKEFCRKAKNAGCTGLIFPDYPLDHEDREGLIIACHEYELDFIPVLNPAATEERIRKLEQLNPSLLYYGMRKGITGAKTDLDPELRKNLWYVKQFLDYPIAVGWGISTAEHVKGLPEEANIAIIGSKTLDIYNENNCLEEVKNYIDLLVWACKK
jgi:tryptophan synthase alpha chain